MTVLGSQPIIGTSQTPVNVAHTTTDVAGEIGSADASSEHAAYPDSAGVSATPNLTETSALAAILGSDANIGDPSSLADALVQRFRNLDSVLGADQAQLSSVPGMSQRAANLLKVVNWVRHCGDQVDAPMIPAPAGTPHLGFAEARPPFRRQSVAIPL